jgi:hypothetical protein
MVWIILLLRLAADDEEEAVDDTDLDGRTAAGVV